MISIRPAVEDDLPALLDIYNHVILNTTAVYSYHPHTLEMRREWYADKLKHKFPVFVAVADGDDHHRHSNGHSHAKAPRGRVVPKRAARSARRGSSATAR